MFSYTSILCINVVFDNFDDVIKLKRNMKKVVIASDSFKGTLSSFEICHLFSLELEKRKDIEPIYLPIADGGEGSLEAISHIVSGQFVEVKVHNLYFKNIKTKIFIDQNNNAYIESASCIGLNLTKEYHDPGLVSTFGVGELILCAIELGCQNIYVFLGGSATNDGGTGLASALGTKFYDKNHEELLPVGLNLFEIEHIDNSETLKILNGVNIHVLSDVQSPFYGPNGAAYKFAKQKGANDVEIKLLDDGLIHLAKIAQKDLSIDINVPGSGAAGGLGGGLYAFANAKISSGIDTLLDLMHFDEIIKDSDAVITGEGKLDRQTFDGKVIDGIAKRCLKFNKNLILLVGLSELSLDELKKLYPCVVALFETNKKHLPFEEIKQNAKEDYLNTIKELLPKL